MEGENASATGSKSETNLAIQEVPPLPASEAPAQPAPVKKGFKFWLIILSVCICLFLSALEFVSPPKLKLPLTFALTPAQTAVSTALPTIIHDLHGDDFVWVGSAYALASTALLPATGGMAQVSDDCGSSSFMVAKIESTGQSNGLGPMNKSKANTR